MRDTIIFYRSFFEAAEGMPPEDRDAFYRACFELAFNDNDISDTLTGSARASFTLAKPTITGAMARYDTAKKHAECGKMGGRPRKDPLPGSPSEPGEKNQNKNQTETKPITKSKPNGNQTETKSKPNGNQTETKTKPNETLYSGLVLDSLTREEEKKEYREKKKKEAPLDEGAFKAFMEEFGIQSDNYDPATLSQMDFTRLTEAYRMSAGFLQAQTQPHYLSWICRNYEKIAGGYYDDRPGMRDNTFDRLRAMMEPEEGDSDGID